VIAIEDGYRERTESWLAVLPDLKTHGMPAQALAIGDGALGCWAARREVWPETREPRCWVPRMANVLDKLPTRLQSQAKRALHEMMYAESRTTCEAAIHRVAQDDAATYPKAVKSLITDVARLLTHVDFPAAHWKHLRSTHPIESTFVTVKHRTRVTKGGWLAHRRTDDDVQAVEDGATHLASDRCARLPPTRPRGRCLQRWAAGGRNGVPSREEHGKGRRLITLIHNS
jgi:hypothetical protein